MSFRKSEKELRKIYEGVFDKATAHALERLNSKDYFDEILSMISRGKEANVYRGIKGKQDIAIKIYAVEASDFKNMEKYILADPRFSSFRNRRHLIYNWAEKEFKNLSLLHDLIRTPEPIQVYRNVLIMEFIGKDGNPAYRMKDAPPENPAECFQVIKRYMKEMLEKKIVHADLSEYNILMQERGKPVIIDLSTGVLSEHPMAEKFLRRDVHNIVKYFNRFDLDLEENDIFKEITQGKD